ncbi:hypothetical protein H6F39_10750 [Anabaena sp. FACHB-1250]|uniref:hypothetical protein n=1 Tax=Anabaena sp. FACHB-1250 TaxID=2692770 RepID=UPI0016815BC8|nr:hypothetical protein [Anabaena sp. FACHB-1250]MBD2141832.1 hypothetical protein [Anabaena sp. FACHB-1250]
MANATLRERPISVQVLPAQGVPHSKLLAVCLSMKLKNQEFLTLNLSVFAFLRQTNSYLKLAKL